MKLSETKNISDYMKAGGSIDSPENQRIVSQLVDREVIYCFSSGFSDAMAAAQAVELPNHSDEEFYNLCRLQPDFEEEGRQQGWVEMTESDWEKMEEGDLEDCPDATFINPSTDELSEVDTWEELAEEQGFHGDAMDNAREALEHWIVTNWAARKLSEHGETTGEVLGLTLWGRGCSGQSIALDWVWKSIAAEMGILVGQESDWNKQGRITLSEGSYRKIWAALYETSHNDMKEEEFFRIIENEIN